MIGQNRQNKVVFLLTLCLSIAFLMSSAVFVLYNSERNEQRTIQHLKDATAQQVETLRQEVESNLQILRAASLFLAQQDLNDHGQINSIIDEVNQSNSFVRMGLASVDGQIDLVDSNGQIYESMNLLLFDFFQQALDGKCSVSATFLDPATGENVNYYNAPVYQNNQIVGVLCGVNTDRMLRNTLSAQVFQGHGDFIVLSHQGRIAGTTVFPESIMPYGADIMQLLDFDQDHRESFVSLLSSGGTGNFVANFNGTEYLLVVQPMGYNNLDLYMLCMLPRADINAYYNHMVVGLEAIIVGACLIFTFMLYWQMHMKTQNQKSIENMTYTDMLTGVNSFLKFLLDAEYILKVNPLKKYVVWSFELKNFNDINAAFGINYGEQALIKMARTFTANTPHRSSFCRISNDLFAGIRPYKDKKEISEWFRHIKKIMLDQHGIIPSHQLRVDAAMGCYCPADFPNENITVKDMVNYTAIARKYAKISPSRDACFFTQKMGEQVKRENELLSSAKISMIRGDISFFLQPKVGIQKDYGIVLGAEALVRWKHQEYGWISPVEFIPLFEDNGLVVELDRYIFHQVCQWYSNYHSHGHPRFQLSVNVSRQGLLRNDFIEYYDGIKKQYKIDDGVLELEFTESVVLDDYERFQNIVISAQKKGFICSIDDFGSGYSSLNVLKNLFVDVLKMDSVFFRDGLDEVREQVVISSLIRMARELRIKIVAEGVETREQVNFLRGIGCDLVQGYYFSKPLSLSEFEILAKNNDGVMLCMLENGCKGREER